MKRNNSLYETTEHPQYLGISTKILLKWILKKYDVRVWSCGHRSDLPVSTKGGEHMRHCQRLEHYTSFTGLVRSCLRITWRSRRAQSGRGAVRWKFVLRSCTFRNTNLAAWTSVEGTASGNCAGGFWFETITPSLHITDSSLTIVVFSNHRIRYNNLHVYC